MLTSQTRELRLPPTLCDEDYLKPIFTIHAGEYLAASEIEERFPELRVWVPSKDTGIDLLVTDSEGQRGVSLQVKFSKDFLGKNPRETISRGIASGGWWTFNEQKIIHSPADFWVLVLYQFQRRTYDFIIIKPDSLAALYASLGRGRSIQSYIWVTNETVPRCWETRGLAREQQDQVANGEFNEPIRELTPYLNAWTSVLQRINVT